MHPCTSCNLSHFVCASYEVAVKATDSVRFRFSFGGGTLFMWLKCRRRFITPGGLWWMLSNVQRGELIYSLQSASSAFSWRQEMKNGDALSQSSPSFIYYLDASVMKFPSTRMGLVPSYKTQRAAARLLPWDSTAGGSRLWTGGGPSPDNNPVGLGLPSLQTSEK